MAEQKRVYLVTSGCYSDYNVNTAWSTREAAERAALEHNTDKDGKVHSSEYAARVEEYWLDEPTPDDRPLWRVRFAPAGAVVEASEQERSGGVGEDYWERERIDTSHEPWPRAGFKIEGPYREGVCGYAYVIADDKAHAIKIASERRAAWIAHEELKRGAAEIAEKLRG